MNKKNEKFAKIELKMVYSEAFQDLNLAARKILDYALFQIKWVNTQPRTRKAKWEIERKENFVLLYSTFIKAPFKLHRQTITRGIDSLLAHGFIEVVSQGGAYRGQKSIYKCIDGWMDWKSGQTINTRKPFFARGFLNKA